MMIKQRILHILLIGIVSTGLVYAADGIADKEKPEPARSVAKEKELSKQQVPVQANQPTFKSFSKDLGKNLVGLFSKENLVPLLVGTGATGIALSLDDPVTDWFGNVDDDIMGTEKSRFGNLEEVGGFLGTQWVVGASIGGLVLAKQFTDSQRFHAFTYASAQGFVLNTVVTVGLKYAVRRERPDQSNTRSFPSGHTSNMFTMATIASHYYGPRVGIPAYIAAGFVGVTRMEKGYIF